MHSKKYDSLINCLRDRSVRYVSFFYTVAGWIENRNLSCSLFDIDEARKFQQSDTIFILGGGESINDITSEQWKHVKKHDSIGLNWWPIHKFVPTYYYTNYPRDKFAFDKFSEILSPRIKEKYTDTLFFVSGNRAVRRGIHPRITPDLFPENANCCFYTYADPITKDINTLFCKNDFSHGNLLYRGALSLVLDLINRIGGYNKIVLLGVDLKNRMHFYDDNPEMKWQLEAGYRGGSSITELRESANQSQIGNKHPLSEYIYALNSLYYKPNGIELFVGSNNSILSDKIPVYNFGNNSLS